RGRIPLQHRCIRTKKREARLAVAARQFQGQRWHLAWLLCFYRTSGKCAGDPSRSCGSDSVQRPFARYEYHTTSLGRTTTAPIATSVAKSNDTSHRVYRRQAAALLPACLWSGSNNRNERKIKGPLSSRTRSRLRRSGNAVPTT